MAQVGYVSIVLVTHCFMLMNISNSENSNSNQCSISLDIIIIMLFMCTFVYVDMSVHMCGGIYKVYVCACGG